MEHIYFISDVHLGTHSNSTESQKTSRLLSFLKSILNQADYLYIVGDLYDFWFEYRKAIPKVNLRILSALIQLADSGTKIRYFIGNHDLWHETYLQNEIGATFYHTPQEFNHNGKRIFIAHGDGLAAGEWKMRLMTRIMKNKTNISLYRLLHPDLGIPLASLFSYNSKKKGPNRFINEYREFAIAKLNAGFDAVILGHTHHPVFEKIENKHYINLGDWIKNFTYVEMNGPSFALKTWAEQGTV